MCGNSSLSKSEGSYYPQGNSICRHLDPILYRIVYTLCLLNTESAFEFQTLCRSLRV